MDDVGRDVLAAVNVSSSSRPGIPLRRTSHVDFECILNNFLVQLRRQRRVYAFDPFSWFIAVWLCEIPDSVFA